jgi:hypothetical protein
LIATRRSLVSGAAGGWQRLDPDQGDHRPDRRRSAVINADGNPLMSHSTSQPPGAHAGRRIAGRAQLDPAADPYHPRRKPAGPIICPECGVFFALGRWQWGRPPEDATPELCPACRRTHDSLPAGSVVLHGRFAQSRHDEIISLARHQEAAEKQEHPLNRIMRIEESHDALTITTTDIHLPRRIGEALKRAHRGELQMNFDEDGYFARVDWRPPN